MHNNRTTVQKAYGGRKNMSFEDYVRYIYHISIEEFHKMSLDAKIQIEYEYNMAYGY